MNENNHDYFDSDPDGYEEEYAARREVRTAAKASAARAAVLALAEDTFRRIERATKEAA